MEENEPPPKYDDAVFPGNISRPSRMNETNIATYPSNSPQQPQSPAVPVDGVPLYSQPTSPPPYSDGPAGHVNNAFTPTTSPVYYPPPPFYPNQYPSPTNGPPPQYPVAYYYAPQPGGQQASSVVLFGGASPIETTQHQVVHSTFLGQIILSCFAMWFCGFIFGFVAFTLAIFGQNSANNGDYARARTLSKTSVAFSVVGIAIGVVAIVIIGSTVGSMLSRTSGSCNPYYYSAYSSYYYNTNTYC